ncbi:Integrator complex subunit 6 [Actinomortierella ambigua]|nr:Integrator complex subunit 6 [Actinomortierella ambigua]
MIVVFLVDTSVSMNQKFSNGMSSLECVKSSIEHLVKSTLKDPLPHLIKELKILKAKDTSNPGVPLSVVFDVLNCHRIITPVNPSIPNHPNNTFDNHGQGRYPGGIEPCIILWFTDGGRQATASGVLDRLQLPGITSAGAELYNEPFRWDQRLYTIFLEPQPDLVDPQLGILSNFTGGASYRVKNLRHMLQAIDCMLGISKLPPMQYSPQAVFHIHSIVVNFEWLNGDARRPINTANHHQLIYVNPIWLNPQARHQGFFPIPESYWPDPNATQLPVRAAQPTIYYHTEPMNVEIPEGFPFDKYMVAPCPMTQELLMRPPGVCWPVYVKNSYRTEGFGFPFGFLRANTNKNAVTLTITAYNYPALFTLIANLNAIPGRIITTEWAQDYREYLSHTPSYYVGPLRAAFKRMGIQMHNLNMPGSAQSLYVRERLENIKNQAKVDAERLRNAATSSTTDATVRPKKPPCANAFDVPLLSISNTLADLKATFSRELSLCSPNLMSSLRAANSIALGSSSVKAASTATVDSDELHTLPVADMGIYQERMQKLQQETLRDPLRDEETTKTLQRTMFGNPYKQDKKISIDEEDEASTADSHSTSSSSNTSTSGSSWSSVLGRKRKPRRRSVSPASPFPIEKIPRLGQGGQSVSGKTQVIHLGDQSPTEVVPSLRILVQDDSGNTQDVTIFNMDDTIDMRMVMHDGEDEDEEAEEFRRAMFNSDEMELDEQDDEAARLRADTPMPGGLGLDDDEEMLGELQQAQDMIPPPIVSVSLEDIERDVGRREHKHHPDHHSGLELNGETGVPITTPSKKLDDATQSPNASKPAFDGAVFDASSSKELVSIPSLPIPSPITTARSQEEGAKAADGADHSLSLSQSEKSKGNTATTLPSLATDLAPIPVFEPPLDRFAPTAGMETSQDSNIKKESESLLANGIEGVALRGEEYLDVPGAQPSTSTKATHVAADETFIAETAPAVRDHLVKSLRMNAREYNEIAIEELIRRIEGAANWSQEQKRSVLLACMPIAKGFRRWAVAALLDQVHHRLLYFLIQIVAFSFWIWMFVTTCYLVSLANIDRRSRRRGAAAVGNRNVQVATNTIASPTPAALGDVRLHDLNAASPDSPSTLSSNHQPQVQKTSEPQSQVNTNTPATAAVVRQNMAQGQLCCQAFCIGVLPCLSLFILYLYWIIDFATDTPTREWVEKGENFDCRVRAAGRSEMCKVEISRLVLAMITVLLVSYELQCLYSKRYYSLAESEEEAGMPQVVSVQA